MTRTAVAAPDPGNLDQLRSCLLGALGHDIRRIQGVFRELRDAFEMFSDFNPEDFDDQSA